MIGFALATCIGYAEAVQALYDGGADAPTQIAVAIRAEACEDALRVERGGVQQYHGCLVVPGGVVDCRWKHGERRLPLEPLPRWPFEPMVPER